MADVLSSGFPPDRGDLAERGDRRPPPGPRPRWLSAVLVLALAAGLAVLAARQGPGRPRAAEPRPAPTAPVRPAPDRLPVDRVPPAPAAMRLDADPGPLPAGVRLLVGGWRPGVLDARTGRLTGIGAPGARGGETVHLRRGPGYTLTLAGRGSRPAAAAALLPDRGRSVDLGAVRDALPRRDGSVVTVVCPAGTGGGCVLGGRSSTGAVLWSRRVPAVPELIRDTPYGLLVGGLDDQPGLLLQLVEPRGGRVIRTFGRADAVLGASDRRVAWRPSVCDSNCPVLVADLPEGQRRTLPAAGGRAVQGAFSPDSERLAVGFIGLDQRDPDRSRQRDGYAAVLDLRQPGWLRVPGLTTGVKSAPVPVWTPDGSRLLLGIGLGNGDGTIAVWRPGDPRATRVAVGLPGFDAVPAEFSLLD